MSGPRSGSTRHRRPGSQPGLLHIDPEAPHPKLRVTAYRGASLVEDLDVAPADLPRYLADGDVVWVNVDGLGDEEALRQVGTAFGLHRLVLEDVTHLQQRPKAEAYDNGLFVVARMPAAEDTEQVSFFLAPGRLITFQEREGDCFDSVRTRLHNEHAVIRRSGSDYLCYALLDAIIDAYFPVVEETHDQLEELEEIVLEGDDREVVARIHAIKRRLQELRRVIAPHREVINSLLRDATDFITPETTVYLRDCYDHLLRLTERVEVYRERCSDLMSTHLSLVSNRMNEVMKVLTVFATIFMPLGFIAGLYGMNFNPDASPWNMPELDWFFGYPMALGAMALTGLGLLYYFKRKNWL